MEMNLNQYIGQEIFNQRQLRGWTQRDLSIKSGFRQARICELENGKIDLRISELLILSNVFEVDIKVFLPKLDVEKESSGYSLEEAIKVVRWLLENALFLPRIQ